MNSYIEYLSNPIIPANNHYLIRLIRLLTHFKQHETTTISGGEEQIEDHHIVPFHWLREMGPLGEHKSRKRNLLNCDNFVYLPVRVHFLCHVLYVKAFPNERGLKFCMASMAASASTSRLYKFAKQQRSAAIKGVKIPHRKQYKLTNEHKQNIREAMARSEKARRSRINLTKHVMDNLPIVCTPFGDFKGQKAACAALGIHKRTLQYRLKSPNFPDWN